MTAVDKEEVVNTHPDQADRERVDRQNGIISKEIITEGEGVGKPMANNEVTFHYVGRLPDGTIFDSSHERGSPMVLVLDSRRALPGIEAALLTMRLNEKAVFEIEAYGAAGCGKEVPPDTNVMFEIELLTFAEKERGLNELNGDELLLLAQDLKTEGNGLVGSKRYEEAVKVYRKGCEVMQQDPMKIMEDVMEIELAIRLNMALALLQLTRYGEAKEETEIVLKTHKDSPKAKYRHALANMGLGYLEEARTELLHLAKEEPRNKEIRASLEQCKLRLAESKKKDNEMFGSMFSSDNSTIKEGAVRGVPTTIEEADSQLTKLHDENASVVTEAPSTKVKTSEVKSEEKN